MTGTAGRQKAQPLDIKTHKVSVAMSYRSADAENHHPMYVAQKPNFARVPNSGSVFGPKKIKDKQKTNENKSTERSGKQQEDKSHERQVGDRSLEDNWETN